MAAEVRAVPTMEWAAEAVAAVLPMRLSAMGKDDARTAIWLPEDSQLAD